MAANNSETPEAFRERMEKQSTAALMRIWNTEYRNEWTEEQFQIVGEVLASRGEAPAPSNAQLIDKVIVTTTPTVEGKLIQQYLSPVSSHIVMGTGLTAELSTDLADLFGGRSGKVQTILAKAQAIALQEIREQAVELGGDAIVAVEFDYMVMSLNVLMVAVNGTVVKFARPDEPQDPAEVCRPN